MGMDFKVARLHRLEGNGATKAVCDVTLGGEFVVKGFRVVDGKNGLFVSMPREEGKDGKWYDNAFPLTKETRNTLSGAVLAAYEGDKTQKSR